MKSGKSINRQTHTRAKKPRETIPYRPKRHAKVGRWGETKARTTLGHISNAITFTSQPFSPLSQQPNLPSLGNRWRGMPNARMRCDYSLEGSGTLKATDWGMPKLLGKWWTSKRLWAGTPAIFLRYMQKRQRAPPRHRSQTPSTGLRHSSFNHCRI